MSSAAASSLPQLLPFTISSYDGGHQAGWSCFGISNVLTADESYHCSRPGRNFDLVLRYSPPAAIDKDSQAEAEPVCTATHVVLHTPADCTSPLRTGVVFTSLQPPDTSQYSSRYDSVTQAQYEAMPAEARQADGAVAFFTITDPDTLQLAVPLPAWRDCRYVHLKLVSAGGDSVNIDLQRVAIVGYDGGQRPAEAAAVLPADLLCQLGLMLRELGPWNPLCLELNEEMQQKPSCILFLSDPALPQMAEAAELLSAIAGGGEYSDDLLFFHHSDVSAAVDGFAETIAEYMGVAAEARPAAALVILDHGSSRRYRYDGEMGEAAVRSWLDGFVSHSLTPMLRSAPRPAGDVDPVHERVTLVTTASSQELVMDSPQAVLLFVLDGTLEFMAAHRCLYATADAIVHPQLVIAWIDAGGNDRPEHVPPEHWLEPKAGVLLFPAHNKHSPVAMGSPGRSCSDLVSFLSQHAPELELNVARLTASPELQAAEADAALLTKVLGLEAELLADYFYQPLPVQMPQQAAVELVAAMQEVADAMVALRERAAVTGWRDVEEERSAVQLGLQQVQAVGRRWQAVLQDLQSARRCIDHVTQQLEGAQEAITDAEFSSLSHALAAAVMALPEKQEGADEGKEEQAALDAGPAGGRVDQVELQPLAENGGGQTVEDGRQSVEAQTAGFSVGRLQLTQEELQLVFEGVKERLAAKQAELAAARDGRLIS